MSGAGSGGASVLLPMAMRLSTFAEDGSPCPTVWEQPGAIPAKMPIPIANRHVRCLIRSLDLHQRRVSSTRHGVGTIAGKSDRIKSQAHGGTEDQVKDEGQEDSPFGKLTTTCVLVL